MNGINRITRALDGRPGVKLMTHAVCGYPDVPASLRVLSSMADAGADVIEAQLPFSDPSADGRSIVEANHAALRSGARVRDCLDMLGELRRGTQAPILVMSYLNPILAYGAEAMVERAARTGLDGFIVPDCPDDEPEPELRRLCAEAGLAFVPLVAPTTSVDRARHLAEISSSPLLYVVTRLGVTGRRTELDGEGLARLRSLREATGRKVAAGFGIRERSQIEALSGHADCAIVGSALVDAARAAIEAARDPAEAAAGLVRSLKGI